MGDVQQLNSHLKSKGSIISVGSSFPSTMYSQETLSCLFGVKQPAVSKFIATKHIEQRHLYLKTDADSQLLLQETQEELLEKFHRGIEDIGVKACEEALSGAGLTPADVQVLVAVTSSGFAVPGMSSIVARKLQLRDTVHRLDVVGMGCNGGMSALHTALMMAQPSRTVLMVCCEINSAIYLQDGTVQCGLVNSLFGDGAAAVVIQGESSKLSPSPRTMTPSVQLIEFESFTIPEYADAMRFDWNAEQKKWGFFLSREIPWVVGNSIPTPVRRLLARMQLSQADIQHWVMHSGGGAVMDAAQSSLGLNASDLRHSRSVLRDYGNISSGSFLVSLQRLLMEGTVVSGDLGLLIAMGPGATIEASLCRFV